MRRLVWNLGLCGAGFVLSQGCGARSVEHAGGDDAGAVGGDVSVGGAFNTGGSAGRAAGRGGAAGRGVAGREGAGRGGGAGHGVGGTRPALGGSGGDAGGPDVGGSTTIGGAGSGNDDPKVIPSNANCHCVLEFDGWFSCTMILASATVSNHATAVCDQPDTLTTRVPCDDGGFAYHWVEGGENDYDLSVDGHGDPTYYSAFGYVGAGCGVPSEYQLGSIEAGTQSSSCFGEYTCAPCNDGVTDVPHCPVCERDPNGGVKLSLEEFCLSFECPASAAAARDAVTRSCNLEPRPTLERGCGIVAVRGDSGFSGVAYYYDEQSGVLVGAYEWEAQVHEACNAFTYVGGNVPSGTCDTATTCSICTPGGNGAAGAAGEGGSGPPLTGLCDP